MEEWIDVKDYEGLYQVSNLGRVRSLQRKKTVILKQRLNNWGYYDVALYKHRKQFRIGVHRIVAFAFVDGWFPNAVVNHKDENKRNNIPSNLEWITNESNLVYGTATKRSGINRRNRSNTKQARPINQLSMNGKFIKCFPSTNEVERELGFDQGNIVKACRGIYKQAYGFKWSYK